MPSEDADESKVIEDVQVPTKISSIIEDISVGSNIQLLKVMLL